MVDAPFQGVPVIGTGRGVITGSNEVEDRARLSEDVDALYEGEARPHFPFPLQGCRHVACEPLPPTHLSANYCHTHILSEPLSLFQTTISCVSQPRVPATQERPVTVGHGT